MNTRPLQIGQISDLHLRHHLAGTSAVKNRRSRDMPALFIEALAAIEAAAVDLLVVTGDLVDHPFEDEDRAESLRQGEADLRLVADSLSTLTCPWIVLPGNHDHPELFDRVFGTGSAELDIHGVRVICFHDWDRNLDGAQDAAVNVPRRVAEQRSRLTSVLADDDPRLQIHLQHYVITPELNEGWPHTNGDGAALRDALVADARVRLGLSGHYHPGVESFHEGDEGTGTWFHVAPAFCQAPHPYVLHRLEADGTLNTTRIDLRPHLEMS